MNENLRKVTTIVVTALVFLAGCATFALYYGALLSSLGGMITFETVF